MKKIILIFSLIFAFVSNNAQNGFLVTPQNVIYNGGNLFNSDISIGSNDNYNLFLKTNNSIVGTFSSSGFFGLGTTTPSALLHVTGGHTQIDGNGYMTFGNDYPNSVGLFTSNGSSYMGVYSGISKNLGLGTNFANAMLFYGSSNNIGIANNLAIGDVGTEFSTSKFHVRGIGNNSLNYTIRATDVNLNDLFLVRDDGVIIAKSLPTSPVGLPSGAIWVSGTVLNIVP